MENIPYIETGTYLFRFMDPRGQYFWPSITNMLSQNILVLNSRRNFNDPFDSQPIIDNDLSNSAIRDYFRNMLEEPFHPRRSLAGAFRILELKTSGKTNLNKKHVENIKAGLHKSAKEILDLAGILSFSLTAENPLLWGSLRSFVSRPLCSLSPRSISK